MRHFTSLLPMRFVTNFARARRGATAVEFALVSLPLLAMIMGTLELAMVIIVITSLQGATESAGRMIRTGEFQTSAANTRTDFKQLVCARMGFLAPQCASNLTVDVQTFASFNSLASNQPQAGAAFNPAATCFSAGRAGDIVLVRTYFTWPLFTPILDGWLDNMGDGRRLLSSTTAFRNEPYNESPPVGASC